MTVLVNEVQKTFLMLYSHLHSCIFVLFCFHVLKKKGKKEKKKTMERKNIRTKSSALVSLLKDTTFYLTCLGHSSNIYMNGNKGVVSGALTFK